MGNLAERYQDAKRSGLYRVSSPAVPVMAAIEARAYLRECNAAEVESELRLGVRQLAERPRGRPYVLLVRDAIGLDDTKGDRLIRRLQFTLRRLDAATDPCFLVLVDPSKVLALPNLWREPELLSKSQELSPYRSPGTPFATLPAADRRHV